MKIKEVEKVLYFESFIIIEPGLTTLKKANLWEALLKAQDDLEKMHSQLVLGKQKGNFSKFRSQERAKKLRESLVEIKSKVTEERTIKRLKLIESFISSGNKPEWMILTSVPVIPPEFRPLVPLVADLHIWFKDLYRRVINRNNRLKRLLDLKRQTSLLEMKKECSEFADALFDNGRRGRVITGTGKRPLKSLAEMLKGKQGRFRQNLLGKRLITRKIGNCCWTELTKTNVVYQKKWSELFKPFQQQLNKQKIVEKEKSEVWDSLNI